MKEKEFIKLVSKLISGLHVPRALGVLGAAQQYYDEIRDKINDFGYSKDEEIEQRILSALGDRDE